MRTLIILFFLTVVLSLSANATTLAWNANTDGVTTGYDVYIGTAAGAETLKANVGLALTYDPGVLAPGTYFSVVRAFNSAGVTSPPSNEVSWVVAAPTPTPTPTPTPLPTPLAPQNLHITVP
jgi:hypothetical protein